MKKKLREDMQRCKESIDDIKRDQVKVASLMVKNQAVQEIIKERIPQIQRSARKMKFREVEVVVDEESKDDEISAEKENSIKGEPLQSQKDAFDISPVINLPP